MEHNINTERVFDLINELHRAPTQNDELIECLYENLKYRKLEEITIKNHNLNLEQIVSKYEMLISQQKDFTEAFVDLIMEMLYDSLDTNNIYARIQEIACILKN